MTQPKYYDADQLQADHLIDVDYYNTVKLQLRQASIQSLKDWGIARGFTFGQAVISLAKGGWDDVKKDVKRGRITLAESIEIVDEFLRYGAITADQRDFYVDKFYTQQEKNETI